MIGDQTDMTRRIRAVLPSGWMGDDTPILDAIISGIAVAFASCYEFIQFTIAQSRIATAYGGFLDLISLDFFGLGLPRRLAEPDASFQDRILSQILLPRVTRGAIGAALVELTGQTPIIFEPARSEDTGGYCAGGAGYAIAGGWGNLALPFQFFITVFRPAGGGIAGLAGYATGGIPCYGSLNMENIQVSDTEVMAGVASLLPVSTTAWTRII
jgi:hypothetical protein